MDRTEAAEQSFKEWEIVEEFHVFPPLQHEGLEISQQVVQEPELPSPSSSSLSSSSSLASLAEEEKEKPETDSSRSKLLKYFGSYLVVFRRYLWPIGSVTGIAALLLVLSYASIRRWRRRKMMIKTREDNKNQLLLLVKEKDKRINQLLLQVAEMKALLSTRHRVAVHRIA